MKKVFIIALVCMLVFTFAGCKSEASVEEPADSVVEDPGADEVEEPVDDGLQTETYKDGVTASFNPDDFVYSADAAEAAGAGAFQVTFILTMANDTDDTITINRTGTPLEAIDDAFLQTIVDGIAPVDASGQDVIVTDAEVVELANGQKAALVGQQFKMTQAFCDNMVAWGVWTQEFLDSVGGANYFIGLTSAMYANLYTVVDGELVVLTATYGGEGSKPMLIEGMTEIAATIQIDPDIAYEAPVTEASTEETAE